MTEVDRDRNDEKRQDQADVRLAKRRAREPRETLASVKERLRRKIKTQYTGLMHKLIPLILLAFLLTLVVTSVAQDKTIVLVRHAERDGTMTSTPDPPLSAEGKERAERLAQVIKKYKPHEIFSTDFKRTRDTAAPIAAKRHKVLQIYDATKAQDLIDKMMKSTTEHYLIVGHSNTIPMLANLLAKKEVFRQLLETEYGVIWVVKIRKGVFKKIEVLPY